MASRTALFFFVLSACAGCMSKNQAASLRTGGDAMPVVEVKPGYAERIALMDQYRLHDELRKHMMHRPHVTVEELTEEEVQELRGEEDASPPEEPLSEASTSAPATH